MRRPEEDAVTLERFVTITAGFTRPAVRVAMVRAIADLRLGTAEFPLLRRAGLSPSLSCRVGSAAVNFLSPQLVAGSRVDLRAVHVRGHHWLPILGTPPAGPVVGRRQAGGGRGVSGKG